MQCVGFEPTSIVFCGTISYLKSYLLLEAILFYYKTLNNVSVFILGAYARILHISIYANILTLQKLVAQAGLEPAQRDVY